MTILTIIGILICTLFPLIKKKKPQSSSINLSDVMNCIIKEHNLEKIDEQNPEQPQSIILKEQNFDVNKIKEWKGEEIKKFEFRPRTFSEFISQEQAKEQAKTIIKKANRGIKSHVFFSARQGCGKTSFVKLLANELKAKIITRVGKQLNEPDTLIDVINEINTSKEKNIIFFLDECDSMDKKMVKMLNPIIEEFSVSGKQIKPFILACATINKDVWIKNSPDTLDRIGHSIQFTPYSSLDIKKIIKQYKEQLYYDDNVSEEVFDIISNSCKYCPRIGISLLEDFIVEKDINKILNNRRIIKNGLTEQDIKILQILNQAIRPMGANAIALRSGLNEKQYIQEFEPFLYEFDYINRIPSRIISEKGKLFLKELCKEA